MIVGRNMISISSRLFPYSSFPDFWFSAHTTYNVDGIITAAPTRVETAGISPNTSAPTAALHMSSVYRNGASAEASAVVQEKCQLPLLVNVTSTVLREGHQTVSGFGKRAILTY